MTVKELTELTDFTVLALPCPATQVEGCYIGDLLSWVMGRASENNAWLTIMSNENVIAVATLAGISAVILCENVRPSDEMIRLASDKGVNLLVSSHPIYKTSLILSSLAI